MSQSGWNISQVSACRTGAAPVLWNRLVFVHFQTCTSLVVTFSEKLQTVGSICNFLYKFNWYDNRIRKYKTAIKNSWICCLTEGSIHRWISWMQFALKPSILMKMKRTRNHWWGSLWTTTIITSEKSDGKTLKIWFSLWCEGQFFFFNGLVCVIICRSHTQKLTSKGRDYRRRAGTFCYSRIWIQ